MNANQMKHTASLAAWKERIIECRASDVSVKSWCEQNGYTPSTYYRWEREIFGKIKKTPLTEAEEKTGSKALIPVSGQTLVELPVGGAGEESQQTQVLTSAFRPVAVVRMGTVELSLTNGVSPKLMKQLKELLSHVE